ncbi:duf1115 domain protein [Colletotrichum karsti]|uniref:Duf1115 domain protein n=1 Tax=Colletotrichum karsti TaxID=1095194 RepID=A0A9P6IHD2_9PEZI|nr:duf1115 domain protein [Colletotrichum karsti]KAF9882266.1 duf1115 domain protein [Colletotrichum karsti]
MSTDNPSWHLLPIDLIEHQIGQIDLLMAMYPDTVTFENDSSSFLEIARKYVEEGTAPDPAKLSKGPPTVTLLFKLAIPEHQDKALHLDISVPFSYSQPEDAPEDPPRIRVRIQQPPWMNRASTSHLNSQIPEEEDLFGTIESITDAASAFLSSAAAAAAEEPPAEQNTAPGPLVRVWFYFPSISTRSKRDDFVIHAPRHHLTGFLYAGKPGLLCVEGPSRDIDDYMRFIKTESWGDIPAHHKKVSERHREVAGVRRVFADMQEITDSVGERRGQRANRGDMKAVEGWLVERGLGDAFAKVLM